MRVRSFPPLAGADARILILGSMPGRVSLEHNEYYAHPRNAFWRIMGDCFGCGPELAYAERARCLQGHGVAVWDVLKSCIRAGSLDSDIDADSERPNDVRAFLRAHRQLRFIYFNGGKAEQAFRKHLGARIAREFPQLSRARLPSTSPAHAGLSYLAKLRAWKVIADAAPTRAGSACC
jgi:hypoxanthine-DNA glycosylase